MYLANSLIMLVRATIQCSPKYRCCKREVFAGEKDDCWQIKCRKGWGEIAFRKKLLVFEIWKPQLALSYDGRAFFLIQKKEQKKNTEESILSGFGTARRKRGKAKQIPIPSIFFGESGHETKRTKQPVEMNLETKDF
jgi:hypothetical protein